MKIGILKIFVHLVQAYMNDFGLDRYKICWRSPDLRFRSFVMYYIYANVRAITTYRVYRLYDIVCVITWRS